MVSSLTQVQAFLHPLYSILLPGKRAHCHSSATSVATHWLSSCHGLPGSQSLLERHVCKKGAGLPRPTFFFFLTQVHIQCVAKSDTQDPRALGKDAEPSH